MDTRLSKGPSAPLFLKALAGEATARPPIWLMRQAGRYLSEYRALRDKAGSFLDLCYTPELATEVTLQPIRRFGFDAAILFSDILVIPHAMGQKLEFREGEGPVLDPIGDDRELGRLRPGGCLERLAPVFETVQRLRDALPPEVPLIGFCGAPWTVATYMVAGRGTPDQAPARLWAYRDPAGFARLIDILVEVSAAYLIAQIEAGAQAVQIFDSWAGSLPEGAFRRWSLEPNREIVKRVKAQQPDVPVIGFPRAAGPRYESFVEETGVDAVACDTTLAVTWIRDKLQSKVAVQGNLDPLLLVAGGQAMEDRVREIIDVLGAGPFVFNLGHGIVPQTPPEHVARLVEIVRDHEA